MTLILLFPSSEGVEEQNSFFLKFDFLLWNQLYILEAHPGGWEIEEQGEFYVWGTGLEISNFIQGN